MYQFLHPSIGKIQTLMNLGIYVQTQVVVILHKLATGNTLSTIGDLYGISENATFVIVHEHCKAIVIHLKPLLIEPLTSLDCFYTLRV